MKHKNNQQKLDKKSEGKKKSSQNLLQPKWLIILLALSIIGNLVWLTLLLMPNKPLKREMELAASRGAFSVLTPKVVADEEDQSFSIKMAELWDNRLQRMNGYVCVFPLKHFPSCSLIVDGELKIVSIGSLQDIKLAGKSQYLGGYFSKFFGLTIRSLAGNSGIFKPDEEEMTLYAEQFKSSLLKALKTVYIRVNGADDFDQLFPNGMNLASVGDYVKKFTAIDMTGKPVTISDFQNKKNAIIYVDVGCGSCMSKCASIRDLLASADVHVLFIADGDEAETKSFMTNYVQEETVVLDMDKKVSNQLYLGEAPYLMLIDKQLKVHFKAAIDDVSKDAEPAINEFLK